MEGRGGGLDTGLSGWAGSAWRGRDEKALDSSPLPFPGQWLFSERVTKGSQGKEDTLEGTRLGEESSSRSWEDKLNGQHSTPKEKFFFSP